MTTKEIYGLACQMVIANKKLEAIKMLEYYETQNMLNVDAEDLLYRLKRGERSEA